MEEPVEKKKKKRADPVRNNLAVKRLYYKNPENQKSLRERIKNYIKSRDVLDIKIKELSQYLVDSDELKEMDEV